MAILPAFPRPPLGLSLGLMAGPDDVVEAGGAVPVLNVWLGCTEVTVFTDVIVLPTSLVVMKVVVDVRGGGGGADVVGTSGVEVGVDAGGTGVVVGGVTLGGLVVGVDGGGGGPVVVRLVGPGPGDDVSGVVTIVGGLVVVRGGLGLVVAGGDGDESSVVAGLRVLVVLDMAKV